MRLFLILGVLFFSHPAYAAGVELGVACGSVGSEGILCQEGARAWAKKTGNSVRFIATPRDATNRLALYQQLLAAGADTMDVMQVDVIWPGILGRHLLDLSPYFSVEEQSVFFQSAIANNTVGGKLVAIPWFMDTGLLYYRKDLLGKYGFLPPQTWQELEEAARTIMSKERLRTGKPMWGYVFQGRAYEGLTCNAMEWLAGFNGGTIVDSAGQITINNVNAAKAFNTAAGWVGTISPKSVLNYAEEESRSTFERGEAVFMRNWPYAWFTLSADNSPLKDKVAITYLPRAKGAEHLAGTLGGSQVAISRYSNHPELAADLVKYLTTKEELRRRAIVGALSPPRPDLYSDGEILNTNPHLALARDVYKDAAVRPSAITGLRYNQVSYEFWNTVHNVMEGREKAEPALAALDAKLKTLSREGQW